MKVERANLGLLNLPGRLRDRHMEGYMGPLLLVSTFEAKPA